MTPTFDIVAAPRVSRTRGILPEGACDAHTHVFGPFSAFPPLQSSAYALPDASPIEHAAMRNRLGMARGVLVQPAPYGNDPSALLNAISTAPANLRGVAVATPDVSEATLETWKQAGIAALRFVEMRTPGGDRYAGSVGFEELVKLAPSMRRVGLHAHLWGPVADIARWLPRLAGLRLPLVLDHMACPDLAAGVKGEGFRTVLNFAESEDIWVKLSLCRVSKAKGYVDARPFHDALVAHMPERLLWGSDWPYVRMEPAPDAAALLEVFQAWVVGEETQQRILVENPAQLFGFRRSDT